MSRDAVHRHVLTLDINVEIRLAREGDLPRMEWYGLYKHYRRLFRQTYQAQLAGSRLMWVAIANGFPIGQIFVRLKGNDPALVRTGERAYLYSLRVMEAFRGRGLGTRLILTAEDDLIRRGYRWATIAAAFQNPAARRLYERLGYRVFGEDPGRWQYIDHNGELCMVEEPCWLLEKQLVP